MKKRIDVLLAERGLAKSREKAKVQVIAGNVWAAGRKVLSASEQFDEAAQIEVKADACPYVSRGGLKLEKALQTFGIDLSGKICADIGASTGGFTDCMLKNGAALVYAVDVGYGQFDWALRQDERVRVLERTNARYLEPFDQRVDFISIDVSFISLALVFPAAIRISGGDAEIVALIKPQFEAGREKVGKRGVVKSPETHIEVIQTVAARAAEQGLCVAGLVYSPVKGPSGNIEYLIWLKTGEEETLAADIVYTVVEEAHRKLQKV